MAETLRQFIYRYFNRNMDFRRRLFVLLALAGMLTSLIIAVSGLIIGAGIVNIAGNLLAALVALFLLVYSQRSGRYRFCYLITVVIVFLLLFPALFFSTGGYHSGMPPFFVFAIVFTVMMLDGKLAVGLAALELCVYVGLCLVAYRYPHLVNALASERALLADTIVGFVAVSVILGITMLLQLRLYIAQQKQLAAQNAALEAASRRQTEFFANISHELKTPLTVISGYAQNSAKAVAAQPEAQEIGHNLRVITSEAERLGLLVEQLLDLTRIEEGRFALHMRRQELTEIVQNTLNMYRRQFSKNRNRLVFIPADGLPAVNCDDSRIMQVLVNLLSNAARHTKDGVITVSLAQEEGAVCVTVADNGEGIAADKLPQLFERYKSGARPARDGEAAGSGLGLYICKHILEAHGGRIALESEPGVGTTVRFCLPC